MLKVQFLNLALGPLLVQPDDPVGINEVTKTIKRSSDDDGIIYEVILELKFLKGARKYLKNAFATDGGLDCVVLVNVYSYNPNSRRWSIYSESTVNWNKYDLTEEDITITLEQIGVQRRVTNLRDNDVDQETTLSKDGILLPANTGVIPALPLHSKTILKESQAFPAKEGEGDEAVYVERQFLDVFSQDDLPGLGTTYRERIIFGQMATEDQKIKELEEGYQTSFGYSDLGGTATVGPKSMASTKAWLEANPTNRSLFPVHTFKEAGTLDINLIAKVKHEIEAVDVSGDIDVCGDAALGEIEIFHWIELRNSFDEIIFLENVGEVDMGSCVGDVRESVMTEMPFLDEDIPVGIGWKVYWFHTVRIYGDYENNDVGSESVSHHFRITPGDGYIFSLKNKTVAPGSTAKAVLLYEAFQRCCQYYTNDTDCFISTLLGRTDLQMPGTSPPENYPADGDASLIVWTNGAALRALDKPIFTNLSDLLEFVNSLFCVGFGFEVGADGKQRMRVERRSYFYNKNTKILSLGKVYNIRKTIDNKRYYNQIEYGYASKVDVGQTNAIDAVNTKRRSSIPVTNTKNQLKISTKVKTDGYQIEQARRLQFSTEDGKNDDEPFAICVIRDGEGFKSKKNEGYEFIENVFDPDNGYNYDISPQRTYRNWFKVIAASLIYAKSKVIKFTYGEVNFLMRTKKLTEDFVVEENGDVDLSDVEPDYDPFIFDLKDVPISNFQVQILCNNPYGYIDFEDRFGEVMEGFVSDGGIEHDPNKRRADFKLLKVFRP